MITKDWIKSDERRIFFVKAAVVFSVLLNLYFSYKLFLTSRLYPLTPVHSFFPQPIFPVDYVLLAVLIGLLIVVAILHQPRVAIAALLGLLFFYALGDQGRWYPSYFEYTFMFLVLGAYFWHAKKEGTERVTLNTLRFMVGSIYIWSGIQKLNPAFAESFFIQFILPLMHLFPFRAQSALYLLGSVAPFVEMAIGIGLLTRKFRTISLAAVLAMHILIFFSIGPLRGNWNNSAWAWNCGSMVLALVLFFGEKIAHIKEIIFCKRPAILVFVILLFGLMPLLNFFGLWDSALAFNVYSGNTTWGVIYLDNSIPEKLPPNIRKYVQREDDKNILSMWRWSEGEFHAGPYPEKRVFKNIFNNLCHYTDGGGLSMELHTRTNWISPNSRTLTYSCGNE